MKYFFLIKNKNFIAYLIKFLFIIKKKYLIRLLFIVTPNFIIQLTPWWEIKNSHKIHQSNNKIISFFLKFFNL